MILTGLKLYVGYVLGTFLVSTLFIGVFVLGLITLEFLQTKRKKK